jgi:hypothetical protein
MTPPLDNTDIVFLDDCIEVTYSRSYDLAVVQYEKKSVFTSMKVRVPADTDLEKLGEKFSDMLNDIQGADLNWARAMTNNKGSLITKIIPYI